MNLISPSTAELVQNLQNLLYEIKTCNIAVSGGIDSTLLAVIAGRTSGLQATMIHAVSPAVPVKATNRVKQYAHQEAWNLKLCDVGEFGDEKYISNPVNRCYYCKSNLYTHIFSKYSNTTLSGANQSDLSDYRPGLTVAKEFGVRHPYIEAGIGKSQIRAMANSLDLHDLSELPASPCLSSRIETGIPIQADWLIAVDRVENSLRTMLNASIVRCRIRKSKIEIQLDADTLSRINGQQKQQIHTMVTGNFSKIDIDLPIDFSVYQMGSAFLH